MSLAVLTKRPMYPGRWMADPLWRRARMVPAFDIDANASATPIDRISGLGLTTHTRVASATYIDSDGLLKTAPTNLLLRSEEFDNASWTLTRLQAFGSGLVANTTATLDPAGGNTAEKIVEDTTAANTHFISQTVNVTSGVTYTGSVFLKAAERYSVSFISGGTPFGAHGLTVDLRDGSISSVTGTPITHGVIPIGNGWYRLYWAQAAGTTSGGQMQIRLRDGSNQTYTGDGTSGIYIWGAQIEVGSTPTAYLATSATQRSALRRQWDATNQQWGWLVEEARTNLLVQSEEFDNASWPKSNCSVVANQITAPSSALTADLLAEDAVTANHLIFQNFVSTSGTVYAYSAFLKAATRSFCFLTANGAGTLVGVSVNLSTGVATSAVGSPASIRSLQLANGWWWVSFVYTSATTGNISHEIRLSTDGVWANRSYTGDGTSGIYIWGAQLEAGAFPTSYIPTGAAAATRDADVWTVTGSNFSRFYRQDEGTLMARCSAFIASTSIGVASLDDNTVSNRIELRHQASTGRLLVTTAGAGQATVVGGNIPAAGTPYALAGSYKVDDFAASQDGALPGVDTLGTIPTVSQLSIGRLAGNTGTYSGLISRLVYFPARLSNSTLQEVTR